MLKITPLFYDQPTKITFDYPLAVLIIQQGHGTICIEQNCAELVQGRVFLLRQKLEINLEAELLIGFLIQFREALMEYFLFQNFLQRNRGLYKLNCPLPYTDHSLDDFLFYLAFLGRLTHELEQHSTLSPYFLLLFFKLINRDAEVQTAEITGHEHLINGLFPLIDQHFKQHRDTRFYAKKLGMNDRDLNSLTKKMLSKKVFKLVMQRVLAEADLLLKQKHIPIKSIAYELGFSQQSHFGVVYKRYRGMSPQEFRDSNFN